MLLPFEQERRLVYKCTRKSFLLSLTKVFCRNTGLLVFGFYLHIFTYYLSFLAFYLRIFTYYLSFPFFLSWRFCNTEPHTCAHLSVIPPIAWSSGGWLRVWWFMLYSGCMMTHVVSSECPPHRTTSKGIHFTLTWPRHRNETSKDMSNLSPTIR